MTACPLAPQVKYEGMCDQVQCPFHTELEETGCWHGKAPVTVDSILRYKQADTRQRKVFREYLEDLKKDLARLEIIRSYRWDIQAIEPTAEDLAIWERLRDEEPWSFPELKMNAGVFAAMNRQETLQSYRTGRPADPEMTLEQLLLAPFATIERNEQ